jgi:hypothetical protein
MQPYMRIYHYHMRKTAGTSLNAAFWALGGLDLGKISDRREIVGNGLKFVRHDPRLIAAGDYFFANSHYPAYRLHIPEETFTITILRDPVARVVSYYRYLLWARAHHFASHEDPAIASLRNEVGTLGGSFSEFLARVPASRLLQQIYMFSERFDPSEAAEGILRCSAVCFTETFGEDLRRLAETLKLNLKEKQERRFGEKVSLSEEEIELLRQRLAPEYAMIERVNADSIRFRRYSCFENKFGLADC